MENAFFVIIGIIIIGSIISSVIKNFDAKTKRNNNTRQKPAPSPQPKREGVDLAKEIKASPFAQSSPYKENLARDKKDTLISQRRKESHTPLSARGNVRVEKSYVEDSMGDHWSQGCEEHYYLRFVSLPDSEDSPQVDADLANIIVMGEVINSPGFKKHRR